MNSNGITIFREKAGITKAELARRTGIHKVQIGRLESGERKLTAEWANKIAPHLNCRPQSLLFPSAREPAPAAPDTKGLTRWENGVTDFAESGSPFLSSSRISTLLGISPDELERLSGTAITAKTEIREVDAALSPIAGILTIARNMAGSNERAALWFKHQPIPGYSGKTAYDLVGIGKADRVLEYLESVRSGAYS